MLEMIRSKRESGIALTTLGFGMLNYNDMMLERLADEGNGNHAYIDTLHEARRVLIERGNATLQTIAADVKVQIEFNPAHVLEYRLIGYENRRLRREDFNNDRVDAGEVGAGHSVTALYEVALVGSDAADIDPLRYGAASPAEVESSHAELAFVKVRYKQPGARQSRLLTLPVDKGAPLETFALASPALRKSAAVAGYGELLRGGANVDLTWEQLVPLAQSAVCARAEELEFVNLVLLAREISRALAHR